MAESPLIPPALQPNPIFLLLNAKITLLEKKINKLSAGQAKTLAKGYCKKILSAKYCALTALCSGLPSREAKKRENFKRLIF